MSDIEYVAEFLSDVWYWVSTYPVVAAIGVALLGLIIYRLKTAKPPQIP